MVSVIEYLFDCGKIKDQVKKLQSREEEQYLQSLRPTCVCVCIYIYAIPTRTNLPCTKHHSTTMEKVGRNRSATRNSWADVYAGSNDGSCMINNPLRKKKKNTETALGIELSDMDKKEKSYNNNLDGDENQAKKKPATLGSNSKKNIKRLDRLDTKLKQKKDNLGKYKLAYKLWSYTLIVVVSSTVALVILATLTHYDSKNLVGLHLNVKNQLKKTLNELSTVTENQAMAIAQIAKKYNLKNQVDRQFFLQTLQHIFLTIPMEKESIVSAMHGLYAYLSDGAVLGVQRIFESYKSTNSFCNDSLMYWCWGSMISDTKSILSTGCEAECPFYFPPKLESPRCEERECEMYEEDYTELHGLDYDSSNIVNKSVNRWIPTSSEEGSITGDIITYISCEARIMHNGNPIVGVVDITFSGLNRILSSISKYFTPNHVKNSYKNGRTSPVLLGVAEILQNTDDNMNQVSIIGSSYLSVDSVIYQDEKNTVQSMTNTFLLLLSQGTTANLLQSNFTVKNQLLILSSQSRYWSVSK